MDRPSQIMTVFSDIASTFFAGIHMQCFRLTFALCFGFMSLLCHAQGVVTSALGARTVLKSYSSPDSKSEGLPIAVQDITFPLKVYETSDNGFLRVKIGSKDIWLDRRTVRIPAESLEANCLTVNRANANLVSGGIRGANEGCK